jgi:hypothetical protein
LRIRDLTSGLPQTYQVRIKKKRRPKLYKKPKPKPKKKRMLFYEDSHRYVDEGKDYTSVTYFLKSHQPYVDWKGEAAKKAKKLGISTEALLAQWAATRDKASARGVAYHKHQEKKYLESQGIIICNTLCPVETAPTLNGIREDKSMKLEDNRIYTEKMIWNKNYQVCGTADLVEVINGKINVKDYKTNETIDFKSWVHPVHGPKKLNYPVNHLDDCKFNLYQLQVNMYMYFLLQQNRNFKMGDMEIHHILFDERDEPQETIVYKVANLQKEVRSMLEAFKSKK